MNRRTGWKHGKAFIISAMLVLATGGIAATKLTSLYKSSDWVDLNDTAVEYTVPDQSVNQIASSLLNVLGQYERLVNSSNPSSKSAQADLDQFYRQAARAYTNALALKNTSSKSGLLSALTESAADLTLSIYEMKDSLSNTGDFSAAQLAKSKQDLASAARLIGEIRPEPAKY